MRSSVLPLLALAALAAGCAPAAPSSSLDAPGAPFRDEADYRQQRAQAAEALDAAIAPAAATTVGACRVVPTSEQACGGPASFAVYSSEDPDAAEAEQLAARLVALDDRANRQFGWASTCMAYVPPTPMLVGGRCAASRP